MTGQQLLFWTFLAATLVLGCLSFFVLSDVLRYRDLQRRLRAERKEREAPKEEVEKRVNGGGI